VYFFYIGYGGIFDKFSSDNEIHEKGDQMSLRKSRPKCSPTRFLSKPMQNFDHGKSSQKFLASIIIKKPAQLNKSPIR
jgi:hypothetical protein